jgi:aromatic ring-cleaving dioxygenase
MSSSYPSLLTGYENYPPLPTTTTRSGKGLACDPPIMPDATKSSAYETFGAPITTDYTTGGFDAHVCFSVTSPIESDYAKELHARIRYEFPELRIYTIFYGSAGPFTTGSFEVSLRTPLEFGTLVAWLVVNRGPLSVLFHANTDGDGEAVNDHTIRAMWLGEARELDLGFFTRPKKYGPKSEKNGSVVKDS